MFLIYHLGKYRVWTLPAGSYTVAARLSGFRERRVSGVELAAGTTLTIHLMLQPGSVKETVTVEATSSQIDVTNPTFVTQIDTDALHNVPRHRAIADLINLAPGVTRSSGFGGTINSNALFVDGVDVTEPRTQAPWVEVPYLWTRS